MVDVKRRARFARPYAKTEGDPVGAASSRPKSLPPTWGEGVTAYAVTDEGSFYPRPCPRGVLSCGAEPLLGILRMKTGGGKTRPYVKTRAARGKRRARFARPLVSHRPPLFCQGRRDTLVGYARQFNTPAAAAQTGGLGVVHHPRRTRAPCPRARVSHIGGPEESGLRDSGGTHVEPWSRRERHPAALCRRGQSKPPRRAESLGGGDGGAEGSPLIRHGIRRDTFPPVGGRL